jgi:hypothetical protein
LPNSAGPTACAFGLDIEAISGYIVILGAAQCTNRMSILSMEVVGTEWGISLGAPPIIPPYPYMLPFAAGPFACGIPPLSPCGIDGKYLVFAHPYTPVYNPVRIIELIIAHGILFAMDIYGKYAIIPGSQMAIFYP